jgi:phospholipid/cholesterol/gamma-HCH transport system substrate-binding protein
MKKYANEFKVGLFIIICILGLAYLTFSTGKVNFKKQGYNIYVVFNELAGLDKKAPVMLNGLEVGKVEDISVNYDNEKTEITLKLWIDEQAKIRQNPIVSIKTLGLMGEKYIQIASTDGSGFIAPQTVLKGESYVDLDAMMKQVQGLVDENKGNITQIVKNLEATSKNFEEFSADLKKHPWKLLFKTKEKK